MVRDSKAGAFVSGASGAGRERGDDELEVYLEEDTSQSCGMTKWCRWYSSGGYSHAFAAPLCRMRDRRLAAGTGKWTAPQATMIRGRFAPMCTGCGTMKKGPQDLFKDTKRHAAGQGEIAVSAVEERCKRS